MTLAKKAVEGSQVYPAAKTAKSPKIHHTIRADNKVRLYEM